MYSTCTLYLYTEQWCCGYNKLIFHSSVLEQDHQPQPRQPVGFSWPLKSTVLLLQTISSYYYAKL